MQPFVLLVVRGRHADLEHVSERPDEEVLSRRESPHGVDGGRVQRRLDDVARDPAFPRGAEGFVVDKGVGLHFEEKGDEIVHVRAVFP